MSRRRDIEFIRKDLPSLDYTDKLVNSMLYQLIGSPGKSAGKNGLSQNSAGTSSDGTNTSAYTSSQNDSNSAFRGTGLVGTGLLGLLGTAINIGYSQYAAKQAYDRQNEFYDNHLSMPAKVQEYKDAGLNPMALGGAGVGTTSAPSIDSAAQPASGLIDVLGQLLNYKLEKERINIEREDVASQIDYRATQKMYQEKVNEWFDVNQALSLDKIQAETKDALQRVRTGEADELLKYAGVSKTEAESALIFQEEMQKLWENSPEWKSVELELKRAQAQSGRANAQNLYADIERIQAHRDNLINDSILKTAQTDIGRQQLINLGLTAEQIKFAVDHQQGDLIWDRVGRAVGVAKDVAVGVGSVMTPIKLGGLGTVGKSSTFTKEYDRKGNLKGSTQTFYTTESGRK